MTRVLFTGEKGSIARACTQYIRERKDHELEVVEIQGAVHHPSLHHPWAENDVTTAIGINGIVEAKPDIVVHSAAVVNTDKCMSSPKKCIDANLLGTHNVIEACKQIKATLIYISTTATYSPMAKRPYHEFTEQRPPTLYGITKYAGELLVVGQHDVSWVVVRPCFVFGLPPYDHSSQLVRVAMHSLLKHYWPEKAGPKPMVTLDPESWKDYMWIEDFASAMFEILKRPMYGDYFNVSYMGALPVQEYFNTMQNFIPGIPLDYGFIPEADYMGNHEVSSERLRTVYDWKPRHHPLDKLKIMTWFATEYIRECKEGKQELLYR
jgi:nucleoside-diphosphate-sugar epimerase